MTVRRTRFQILASKPTRETSVSSARRILAAAKGQVRLLAGGGALAVVLALGAAAEAAIIKLHPQAYVLGRVVRLGDVADVHDADEQLVARLQGVTLAPAPVDGRTVHLDFETIRGRLTAHGLSLTQLEFSGSSTVAVMSASKETARPAGDDDFLNSDQTKKRLEDLLGRAVSRYVAAKNPRLGEVQLEVHWSDDQATLLGAAASARYEVVGGAEPYSGEQTFQFRFFDRQGKRREVPLRCTVNPMPLVIVAKMNVDRGQVLQADDLTWRQLPVRDDQPPGLRRPEDVIGKEAKRPIRAGEPFAAEDLRGVSLIHRGEIVTVLSKRPGITVRMEAKSQSDGALGETVAVVLLDGRQKLDARVTGYHEAVVIAADVTGQMNAARAAAGIRFMPGKPAASDKPAALDKPGTAPR